MYQGVYNDNKKHAPDLPDVLDRSWNQGLSKIIITGGSLEDSKKALDLAQILSGFTIWTGMSIVVVVDGMYIPLVPRVISTEPTIVVVAVGSVPYKFRNNVDIALPQVGRSIGK